MSTSGERYKRLPLIKHKVFSYASMRNKNVSNRSLMNVIPSGTTVMAPSKEAVDAHQALPTQPA